MIRSALRLHHSPNRFTPRPSRRAPLAATVLLALLPLLTACNDAAPPVRPEPGLTSVPVTLLKKEPEIRVRVRSDLNRLTIQSAGRLAVRGVSRAGVTHPVTYNGTLQVRRLPGAFLVAQPNASGLRFDGYRLLVEPIDSDRVHVDGLVYPQSISLESDDAGPGAASFDVVNHVAMEQYLPGVLDKELYRTWHPEMFKAQAIAARSYAITEAAAHQNDPYDLESTQASQAYVGFTSNAKALDAVAQTRGLVLTYQSQVFPAYYSAACGGWGQNAVDAFPKGLDIPPLRGRYEGGWCKASPNFLWGPLAFDRRTLGLRLAAWGRANRHPIQNLAGIGQITVATINQVHRPTVFNLTDLNGRVYPLRCEDFRRACNYRAPNLPTLADAQLLRSSFVEVRVAGNTVQIAQGRGHGHGVGLCQWGAQAMAMEGHTAEAILNFYYPGAEIERAY